MRTRWQSSRGLLRTLLSQYLCMDPADIRFEIGEHGKPRLAGEDGRLRFNVSHSGATGLLAVALDFEVGVDVELPRHGRDVAALAERAFGRRAAVRLERLDEDEREREFRRMWVRHEARLKCLGVGLGAGSNCIGQQAAWMTNLDIEDAVAALATASAPSKVECRRLSQGLVRAGTRVPAE